MAAGYEHGVEVLRMRLAGREFRLHLEGLAATIGAPRERTHDHHLYPGRAQQVSGAGDVGILEFLLHEEGHALALIGGHDWGLPRAILHQAKMARWPTAWRARAAPTSANMPRTRST